MQSPMADEYLCQQALSPCSHTKISPSVVLKTYVPCKSVFFSKILDGLISLFDFIFISSQKVCMSKFYVSYFD